MVPKMLRPAVQAVVIGGSHGAIEALSVLVPKFPSTAQVPVVVVVHLPPGRPSLLPELFRARTTLAVEEAEDKVQVQGGTLWFAPPNYHLMIERDYRFSLSLDPPVHHSRPSIDVLFESAADAYGEGLLAVVLSGANDDGAAGARAIVKAGGRLFVQLPESAMADTMPRAALAATDATAVLPIEDLAEKLGRSIGGSS